MYNYKNKLFIFTLIQSYMNHRKHFKLTEARDMIPEMKIKISRIVDLKNRLNESGYDLSKHEFFGGFGPNGTGKYPKELEELVVLIKDISGKGIVIKDLERGLIDFPHLRKNGEEVYLCFLLGEDDIEFWHRIREGFAGRKHINEL